MQTKLPVGNKSDEIRAISAALHSIEFTRATLKLRAAETKEIITNYFTKFPPTRKSKILSFRQLGKSVHNRFLLVNIVIDFPEGCEWLVREKMFILSTHV